MTARKLIGQLHLWLGLTSGLLVFIIAITGCIYAFQDEIKNATESYRFVERQEKSFLPPSQLQKIAEKELPGKKVHAIMYQGNTNAAKGIFYGGGEEPFYYLVYMNQYTGEVLEVKDENADFFRFIINGHYNLWLPYEIGQPIVAIATLIFFIMVITGIILWWPKNKNAVKQRFRFKWTLNTKWKRKNYDLHNIFGFYTSIIALVFAITGLVWGFEWFRNSYYKTISGGNEFQEYKNPSSIFQTNSTDSISVMDKLWIKLSMEVSKNSSVEIHTAEDSLSPIAVNINPEPETYWKTDYRYFDQYTMKELSVNHIWGRNTNLNNSDKLMRMNYDIHVGSILGLPGKILAFLASLIIASLPITGFLIWKGRRNKSPKKILKQK